MPLMHNVSEAKPPYTKTEPSASYILRKKFMKFCIVLYHINSLVMFMEKVKCDFFSTFAINLNKYAYWTKVLPMMCICGTKFI